jgi:hypothetical protein
MGMTMHDEGSFERHDPAKHACVRARGAGIVSGATADALYACFRDFGGWQAWLSGVAFELRDGGRGTEVGATRTVVFSPEKRLRERLIALDDAARSVTYTGLNYGIHAASDDTYPLSASPFPGAFIDYRSTATVRAVTVPASPDSAFLEWEGEVWTEPEHAAATHDFLLNFYQGNIGILNAHFAAGGAGAAAAGASR